jgi:hypothetical protein
MSEDHEQRPLSAIRAAGRIAALLGAIGAAALLALGLGVPAGAASTSVSENPGLAGTAPSSAPTEDPHTLQPLSQANMVVSDVWTGVSSAQTFSNVTPTAVPGHPDCNTTNVSQMCFTFGTGAGTPQGGELDVQPGGGSPFLFGFFPGGTGSSLTIQIGGAKCSTLSGGSAGFKLDQYALSATGYTVAIQFHCTVLFLSISGTVAYNIFPTDPDDGYYLFDQHGGLTSFGNDNYLAYLDGAQYYKLNAPIVGMRTTPEGGGYWMVGSDGGVFSSGDAGFYGSTGNLHLNKPVVGMAATPDGGGYWFVASDGGIFAYGDAQFYGSMGGKPLNKPIVGMATTPSGNGYWLVASDGGIFAYGDAQFFGSTGSIHLNQAIVGMSPTPSGHGYWFVAADGGIFAYGDAQFFGSATNVSSDSPVAGMASTYSGNGYWIAMSDGDVFQYGDAASFPGSLGRQGISGVAGISLPAGSTLP